MIVVVFVTVAQEDEEEEEELRADALFMRFRFRRSGRTRIVGAGRLTSSNLIDNNKKIKFLISIHLA
jgi:hypothetical protein